MICTVFPQGAARILNVILLVYAILTIGTALQLSTVLKKTASA
jgi:hypothetical protein